jgi:hypothetical protein
MVYNINYTEKFNTLKEFYIPAICHPISKGRTKFHQLSVPLNGQEVVVKKASKKFKYTSFANVILGSVLRMKKLFAPDALNLGVKIIHQPYSNDLRLSFELVNKNKFIIAGEEYILSIVAEYSYKKMDTVTYLPILYRQTCINGQVAILGEQFKEIISVDKILEIGCEWTRCNFESYINGATTYFEYLKQEPLRMSITDNVKFIEKILKIRISNSDELKRRNTATMDLERRDISARETIGMNLERLGNNHFALYNALTEYASNEYNWEIRNKYFLYIGKYLKNEMKKATLNNKKQWSDNLVWQGVENLANS